VPKPRYSVSEKTSSETVRKVAETVSGRGVIADIDTEIGLLRLLFSILGLHDSKLLRLFGQSLSAVRA
jgi:hypothetical protein